MYTLLILAGIIVLLILIKITEKYDNWCGECGNGGECCNYIDENNIQRITCCPTGQKCNHNKCV